MSAFDPFRTFSRTHLSVIDLCGVTDFVLPVTVHRDGSRYLAARFSKWLGGAAFC